MTALHATRQKRSAHEDGLQHRPLQQQQSVLIDGEGKTPYRIVWRPLAETDLDSIIDHIA